MITWAMIILIRIQSRFRAGQLEMELLDMEVSRPPMMPVKAMQQRSPDPVTPVKDPPHPSALNSPPRKLVLPVVTTSPTRGRAARAPPAPPPRTATHAPLGEREQGIARVVVRLSPAYSCILPCHPVRITRRPACSRRPLPRAPLF